MLDTVLSASSVIDRVGAASSASQVSVTRSAQPVSAAPEADFTSILAQVGTGAIDTLKAGEAAAISGITGKASVQSVVEAVMSAEQTLQTAIAIRDKIVTAYLEISRMSI